MLEMCALFCFPNRVRFASHMYRDFGSTSVVPAIWYIVKCKMLKRVDIHTSNARIYTLYMNRFVSHICQQIPPSRIDCHKFVNSCFIAGNRYSLWYLMCTKVSVTTFVLLLIYAFFENFHSFFQKIQKCNSSEISCLASILAQIHAKATQNVKQLYCCLFVHA